MQKLKSNGSKRHKILFIKPPDRFLENEFVYQQLGIHYLQSFLENFDIPSDILILYERIEERKKKETIVELSLNQLNMLFIGADGKSFDGAFHHSVIENYDIVGMSVMTPQASDAYLLNGLINKFYPHITTVIGGSHPRYYQEQVKVLPEPLSFDFIVPYDGWIPMYKIASGQVQKAKKSIILNDNNLKLTEVPPPSRPLPLMERYNFDIAGVPAFHTVTALGCPFSCNFCESGRENLRKFSENMIREDLKVMADSHDKLKHTKKAVMFFDDVGLLNPKQAQGLAGLVHDCDYTTWRAFTHAYLVVKFKEQLLGPFLNTGGKRIGMGLESGSQRSLDLINKRNGKKQHVNNNYEAVKIANDLGIAVDAFTMIFPWEDEQDLSDTTKLVEFVAQNPVKGMDEKGRALKNSIDSTIMTPFQGTRFFDMIRSGKLFGVEMKPGIIDSRNFYYKGKHGGSGWPYLKTRLPKEKYEEVQNYRNSFRPEYR